MFEVRGEGLGAEIYGIDVARPQDVDVQALREVVYRHKLVVLKDIDPTPKQFLDWGKTLGEVRPYYEPIYHHSEYPEIFVSSTINRWEECQRRAPFGTSIISLCRSLSLSL